MSRFKYISLFSGIGGFEHKTIPPVAYCEIDKECRSVLSDRHSGVRIEEDVTKFSPGVDVDAIVGGWPCQDLSSAGRQKGISGERSGLFFEMLRIAKEANADTLVGENVPNLLTINKGRDFDAVLSAVVDAGYPYVSWRVLNAREFGLPQDRKRLFIVASKNKDVSFSLHADVLQDEPLGEGADEKAYGFYWTAGKRSICFSHEYSPALKIGSTDNKGRAPVAVFYKGKVRKLSAEEFIALQGFTDIDHSKYSSSTLLRMAGNAVSVPVGNFVLDCVSNKKNVDFFRSSFGVVCDSGVLEDGVVWSVEHDTPRLFNGFSEFIDRVAAPGEELSAQASAGLIVRSVRANNPMPSELFDKLYMMTMDRRKKLKPSRSNSFEALDEMKEEMILYRAKLKDIDHYEYE